MSRLTKLVVFSILILTVELVPIRTAIADTGPKPTMEFEFQQELTEQPPLTIVSGILYECRQPDCSDASPLEEGGPQGFRCQVNSCQATAYGFAPYHRIEIEFSDGQTRRSNIFETAGFDSKYLVTIRPGDLLVEARFSVGGFPRLVSIMMACLCAFVGVGLIAGLSLFLLRRSRKI